MQAPSHRAQRPGPSGQPDPIGEYERRLHARRERLRREERRDATVANLRLAAFVAAVGLAVAGWASEAWPLWPALVPVAIYLVLVVVHEAVLRDERRAADGTAFYEAALARVRGEWAGRGIAGDDLSPPEHPYAVDLDLFGKGSVFELLCTARTRAGEETLARWLLAPASVETIQTRQRAVDELRERLDLREDLALLGGTVRAQVEPELLVRWGERAPVFPPGGETTAIRILALLLAAGAVLSCVAWATTDLGPVPLAVVALIEAVALRSLRGRLAAVGAGIERPREELNVLATVLGRIEAEPVATPHLRALQSELNGEGRPASKAIARLERLVTWLDSQRNQVFAIVAFLLMWSVHFSVAIDRWRQRSGPHIRRWLAALGEVEALSSLGGYAFEHPADPFPELVAASGNGSHGAPVLEAAEVGHPLLPPATCVPNSVTLGGAEGPRVLIVSGSNMSGKSTLLRAVGVNVVLAMAGAPVRAERLRLTPLQVGATLRVVDSLAGGKSRFYAEIARLKQIVELCGEPTPVLFLLDEILHGTNSHDRQIGAEAVIDSLVAAGAVGLVTTHDLALTRSAERMGARARNVHFEDELRGDQLHFDYRLREGVVRKSNAIDLMRAVGLRV